MRFIDEFRTSIVCCRCQNYLLRSKCPMRYVQCMRCPFTSNRDINAAQNIAQNVFLPLPEIFSRPPRPQPAAGPAQAPRRPSKYKFSSGLSENPKKIHQKNNFSFFCHFRSPETSSSTRRRSSPRICTTSRSRSTTSRSRSTSSQSTETTSRHGSRRSSSQA